MRLLVLADHEEARIWDYFSPKKTEGVDLILSCGDLDPDYLEFLTTMVNRPLFYVRGNHDGIYDTREPLGCDNIEDKVANFRGLRILGLGGSYRYRPGKDMYTEAEMKKRIRHLKGQLAFTKGFDILLTHAPVYGYGDLPDLPHRGFECFDGLLETWHPQYMFHGHVHMEYGDFVRERHHPCGTTIINAYGYTIIDIEEGSYPALGKTGSFFYDWMMTRKKR